MKIKRMKSAEQCKWAIFYKRNGCICCSDRAAGHARAGMCQQCLRRNVGRVRAIMRRLELGAKAMKEPSRHIFARTLGKSPCRGLARYSTSDRLGLFVETFGPPEISGRRGKAFWNFTRDDGGRFSLVSRLPKTAKAAGKARIRVRLCAKAGIRSFWDWTAERLSGIESLEDSPPFLGPANFVIQKLG
jgi:hypothetical protein